MRDVLDVSNELSDALRSLRQLLQSSPATAELADSVPPYTADEADVRSFPLQMAFVGQYSSGKSTLINALTGADLPTGAGVVTERVVEIPWRSFRLIDTPGVETGTREEHDVRARQAYEAADLIVFVTTTQLLDAAGYALLHELAGRQRKARQMVFVLNKAGRDNVSPTALLDAARTAIAPHDLPVVLCDAKDHLEALTESDPEFLADLLSEANLDGLRTALTDRARESGVLGRLATPARAAIELCGQSSQLALDRGEEATASRTDLERTLNSLRKAIEHLEEGAARTGQQLRRRIVELADEPCALIREGVTAEEGSQLAQLIAEADEQVAARQEDAITSLDAILRTLKTRLEAEGQSIAAEGERARLKARRNSAVGDPASQSKFSALRRKLSSELMAEARKGVTQQGFSIHLPTGSRPGGDLHRVVHRVKRARHGSDIQPWSVVRAAEKIEGLTKSINKLSNTAIVQRVASEAADFVVDEVSRLWSENQRRRQSDALRRSFETAADVSYDEFQEVLEEPLQGMREAVGQMNDDIATEAARAAKAHALSEELQALVQRFQRVEAAAQEL
jgi:hypothetical protein